MAKGPIDGVKKFQIVSLFKIGRGIAVKTTFRLLMDIAIMESVSKVGTKKLQEKVIAGTRKRRATGARDAASRGLIL